MTATTRDNVSLGNAGIAEGTNANTYKTSNILHYRIAGQAYVKAATDNVAFAARSGTSFTALTASKVSVFFVLIDAAGTLVMRQSAVKDSATAQTYQAGAFEWPAEEDNYAVIGAIKVATNASGAFTATSTDLGASNQTVTYFNAAGDYGVPITY